MRRRAACRGSSVCVYSNAVTLRTLTAAAAVALMALVEPPLRVSGPLHLFLWTHHIGVPARFVYLVGVWAATWVAFGRFWSVWRPRAVVEARLWLMAGLVIAVLLGAFAVSHTQFAGRRLCLQWRGSQCVAAAIIERTPYDQAALEAAAAALTMLLAISGCVRRLADGGLPCESGPVNRGGA
jgi:hypothetical protein